MVLRMTEEISGRTAKDVFEEMFFTGKEASEIVNEKGLRQVSDTEQLEVLIESTLVQHQTQLKQYRAGKQALFGFFVGQVMKATGGQANPTMVNNILKQKLSE